MNPSVSCSRGEVGSTHFKWKRAILIKMKSLVRCAVRLRACCQWVERQNITSTLFGMLLRTVQDDIHVFLKLLISTIRVIPLIQTALCQYMRLMLSTSVRIGTRPPSYPHCSETMGALEYAAKIPHLLSRDTGQNRAHKWVLVMGRVLCMYSCFRPNAYGRVRILHRRWN